MDNFWTFLQNHGTKVLGFLSTTLGVLAIADPSIIGPEATKWILLASGLVTAWRGFINTANSKDNYE